MYQSVQHLQTLPYMTGCPRLALAVMTFLSTPEMLRMTTLAQTITLTKLIPINGRRKRQTLNSTMDEYIDLTLYVSIEGAEETNSFVLQTTTGDTSIPGNQNKCS